MSRILLVSKPLEPPWNDSSKNLVRDLALGLERHGARALGRKGGPRELGRVEIEPIHPGRSTGAAGGFSSGLSEQGRVLYRLLRGERAALWHFFFAPNPKTSLAARAAARARGVRTLQTVCSVPKTSADLGKVLFAERVVVLSRHTEQRFLDAGIERERVVRIPPAVPPLEVLGPEARRSAREMFRLPESATVVLYPGDLEFGSGALLSVEAHARLPPDTWLVLACRAKTARAAGTERELRLRAERLGTAARIVFTGETPRILDLVGAADIVVLPSEVAYAKMDYPLVLLEAMALARPVVVALGTPAAELAEGGGALAVAPAAEPLAQALLGLAGDETARSELGARAREAALHDYARTKMARAYEQLYDELL
ncbi:MAG TPA: glycosyltransferase family 4 protein [Polyangiaceae bacterium]